MDRGSWIEKTKHESPRTNPERQRGVFFTIHDPRFTIHELVKGSPPSDDELAVHILGPTGNLKAPTLRVGATLLVGFSEEAYRQVLAG